MCSILPVRPITQRVLVIYCSLFCSVPCEALFARPYRRTTGTYLCGPVWGRGGERGRYQTSRLKIICMFIQWGYIIMREPGIKVFCSPVEGTDAEAGCTRRSPSRGLWPHRGRCSKRCAAGKRLAPGTASPCFTTCTLHSAPALPCATINIFSLVHSGYQLSVRCLHHYLLEF